ncbi:hypothetical protein [Serratia sp. (in: enterobacteria)]|uniref:hypothetical protein n=1 Tax=Serratia sp. (in: enterobacteria) TaxID=616 RepID=UPI003988E76D
MEKENESQRQQDLQEDKTEAKVRSVKGSRAWLNTQEMLRRRGKLNSCISASPDEADNEKNIEVPTLDFDTVRHLYCLQLAVGQIKSVDGFSSWVEICELQRPFPLMVSLPTSHIIVPKLIRRKAHAFLQTITTRSDIPVCKTQSLYSTLTQSYKTKKRADEMIARFPLTRNEMERDPNLDTMVYRSIGLGRAPSFTLLLLECNRLGYKEQYDVLCHLLRIITDDKQLRMLGDALFFSLLYQSGEEDLFSSFFNGFYKTRTIKQNPGNKESNTNSVVDKWRAQQYVFINQFINNIYDNFLFDSDKRRKIRASSAQKKP